jgi:hypothetical protein
MAYLKFLDGEELYKVKAVPQGQGNIVTLTFSEEKVINTTGFDLYLDEDGKKNIGGEAYHGYTTIYRDNDDDEYSYQLSNDGSVYVEPEPILEPEIPETGENTTYVSDRQLIEEQNEAIVELAELLSEQNDATIELAELVSSILESEEVE